MSKYFLLPAILLYCCACSKKETNDITLTDNGCVTVVAKKQIAHEITTADYTKTTQLFQKNNIDLNNLRFTHYSEEDLTVNGSTSHYTHIWAIQYGNGLPFFYSERGYHFKDGISYFISGDKLTPAVNSASILSLSAIRATFFKELKEYNQQYQFYNTTDFTTKCLSAELGYYELHTAASMSAKSILAWHVMPEGQPYPEAYINDSDGTVIYFFDGIFYSGK